MSEQNRIVHASARRLIPFMMALYTVGWLDRVNVGFAALTMNRDLGFSPSVFGFGAGIFFLGYFLFQVPASVWIARAGAKRTMFLLLLAWGAISAATAFVQGPASFFALRFLLGVAEAGFFPGMVLYLGHWFPQSYRARYTAGFMTAIPLASIIGGPLSAALLTMEGTAGLHGWQWLFLIEGLPACVLAFVVLRWLPDGPADASWLSSDEKRALIDRLAGEEQTRQRELLPALRDSRVLALCLVGFGIGFGSYGITLWLPQILQAMDFSNTATGNVVALLYIAGMAAMIVWARSSDARSERVWHVILPILLAAAGCAVASLSVSNGVALVALACVAVGLLAADGPFFSLPSSFLAGPAAAGGVALVNAIGSLGAFLGPVVVGILRERTGDYALSMAVLAAGLGFAALVVLALARNMRLK